MGKQDEPYTAQVTPDPEAQLAGAAPGAPEKALDADVSDQYNLPTWRKCIILFVVSWMTLAITFSSTSFLPATPEIASEFKTTTEILNATNAGVLLAMGFSSLIWGPLGNIFGRRYAYNVAIFVLTGCSAGAAAAINMRMFTTMRILAGLTGTSFMVSGQTILADIFEPVVRGTAVGFFMVGSVAGPAIGPCMGGIIVTFASWRIIFWVQTAMAGFGLILSLLFVSNVRDPPTMIAKKKAGAKFGALDMVNMFNPLRIVRQMVYPNVFLADLTCGFLATFQYALLTSARALFNPRFHLTTALVSGLFYLAPGSGFLLGSVLGGKLSDRTVRKWIKRRNGVRLPQDRLNSGLLTLLGVLPVSALIFGWTLQEEVGGMAVPIISGFFGGFGLTGSFNGLNTYNAEAIPAKRSEVIAGKYIVQYIFAAASTAAVQPLLDAIGAGWTFTICVVLSLIGGFLVWAITKWGLDMQQWAERKFELDKKPGF
ncbi:putative MFS transporter [Aspergillus chevalieri]|uniref:Major facilitator superfamily (MFS) profile domain-containing protein n=1 Tax=Aspergillus chevalieri TaxID=182096 RepID=A0A7R7VXC3_ASPCH|nr:uncharacterized protein ACHE_80345A [Aspergillus chevalieri]BCR92445.1 hypothetical protein ACHE_80345A [Aspergillus chevalieri]